MKSIASVDFENLLAAKRRNLEQLTQEARRLRRLLLMPEDRPAAPAPSTATTFVPPHPGAGVEGAELGA